MTELEIFKKCLTLGMTQAGADKAVRRFQEAERLAVDGIAGPKTWARLLARE